MYQHMMCYTVQYYYYTIVIPNPFGNPSRGLFSLNLLTLLQIHSRKTPERTIGKKRNALPTIRIRYVSAYVCVGGWMREGMQKELEVVAGRINSQTRPERVAPVLGDNLTTNECECEYCFCILLFVFLLFYTHTRTDTHTHLTKDTLTCDTCGGVAEGGIRLCKKQEIRIKIYEYSL